MLAPTPSMSSVSRSQPALLSLCGWLARTPLMVFR